MEKNKMTEWETVKLGDVCNITMGTSPKGEDINTINGFPFFQGSAEFGNRYPMVEKFTTNPIRLAKKGDILFSVRAPVGDLNIANIDCCIGRGLCAIRSMDFLLQRFVEYALLFTKNKWSAINDSGSVFGCAKRNDLLNFEIPWTNDISVLKRIAGILGALDDKIEVLREQNKTLEQMAQAVFQSWFVDFDIVRAKAAGLPAADVCKKYHITPDIYDLFPSAFSADNLPLGWERKSLPEIATYLNGLPLQKFPPKNENEFLPVIKIAELKARSTVGADKASTEIDPKYIIDDGDVIFSWSGSLAVDIWCCGKGALNQHLFKVSSNDYPKWFYYLWTKKYLFQFQQIAAGKATTMGHIQRSHLEQAKAIVPSEKILERANRIISPLIEKVIENSKQIRTLEQTRDTLLPQLISGKLDVENVSLPSVNDEV